MKKTYEKPEILFESFVSSTNIAANCHPIIDTLSEGSCAYEAIVGETWRNIFTEAIVACELKDGKYTDGKEDEIFGGICYHVPTNGSSLFNS